MRIEDLVTSITQTMDDLRDVLDEETTALKAMQIAGLDAFTDRKLGLEKVFARKLSLLAARREELADIDTDQRADLEDAEAALKASADVNMQAIASTQNVSQRLIDAVVESARQASAQSGGYAATPTPDRAQGFVPVAVNETF